MKSQLKREFLSWLKWWILALLCAALYVAIVSGASIALAQAEEIPILMLETRLPLIANPTQLGLGPSLIVTLPTGDVP